jgi:hypothetical protein
VPGSCVDNAGKVASATSPPFPYQATPPALVVSADPGDATVTLRWAKSANVGSLQVARSPGLRGASPSVLYGGDAGSYQDTHVRDGVRYHYTLTARDQAGNLTVRTITVTPGARLLGPVGGTTVTGPPLLSWTPVRRASYYNVQLYRGGKVRGRKVLSAWPAHPTLQLSRSWSFAGRRYRLRPGRYQWYVWPGFGARSAARYGRAIGSGTFVVGR